MHCFKLFQLVPACSTLFQFFPAWSSLFKAVPTCSTFFQIVPACSILFQALPASFSLFQALPACSNLFQGIVPAWCKLFQLRLVLFQAVPGCSILFPACPVFSDLFHFFSLFLSSLFRLFDLVRVVPPWIGCLLHDYHCCDYLTMKLWLHFWIVNREPVASFTDF